MRKMIGLLIAVLLCGNAVSHACVRPQLDERAIQWSPVIVKANLVSSRYYTQNKNVVNVTTSTWKITQVYDGPLKADAEITVLTFEPLAATEVDPCTVLPAVGKSMVLLLRPIKDCSFTVHTDYPEKIGDAYAIIHRLTEEDATEDAIKDLQQKIADVRKAEAGFNEKDCRFQAETLANAVDDLEADHADSALLDMGPKAVPIIKDVMEKQASGKKRLKHVIDELSPPPVDTGKPAKAEPAPEPNPMPAP